MPVMRRRIFSFASVLSMLLCLATVALWVRSYGYYDGITILLPHPWSHLNLTQVRGTVQLRVVRAWPYPIGAGVASVDLATLGSWLPPSGAKDRMLRPLSFELRYFDTRGSGKDARFYVLALPHWLLLGLLAIVPALFVWRRSRVRARLSGRTCTVCDYDLRATPDRCPECGTPVGTAKTLQA